MRQLEVIAVSDDGGFVLLAGSEDAARPTHQLRIDDRLHAAVRGDLDDGEPRESELTPKEIQARLRAGESVEDVAKAAKVPVQRVMRYAGPVISERDRVVDQARSAKLHRSRGPEAETALGAVVEQRLAATAGLRTETVRWDARRRDDGAWVVSLSYSARGGNRTAQWLWQPSGRQLTSLNALGTRMGTEDASASPRRRPAATRTAPRRAGARPVAKRTAAKRATVKRAAASRTAAKRTATKRVTATGAAGKRTTTRRSAPKPAAPKRAAAPRTTTATPAARRPATPGRASKRVAPSGVAAKRAGAPAARAKRAAPARTRVSTPAPVAAKRTTPSRPRRSAAPPIVEPVTKRTNGRVPIPSWDDVLLGVQRPAGRGRRRS
jgi:hypothetical protein